MFFLPFLLLLSREEQHPVLPTIVVVLPIVVLLCSHAKLYIKLHLIMYELSDLPVTK